MWRDVVVTMVDIQRTSSYAWLLNGTLQHNETVHLSFNRSQIRAPVTATVSPGLQDILNSLNKENVYFFELSPIRAPVPATVPNRDNLEFCRTANHSVLQSLQQIKPGIFWFLHNNENVYDIWLITLHTPVPTIVHTQDIFLCLQKNKNVYVIWLITTPSCWPCNSLQPGHFGILRNNRNL